MEAISTTVMSLLYSCLKQDHKEFKPIQWPNNWHVIWMLAWHVRSADRELNALCPVHIAHSLINRAKLPIFLIANLYWQTNETSERCYIRKNISHNWFIYFLNYFILFLEQISRYFSKTSRDRSHLTWIFYIVFYSWTHF